MPRRLQSSPASRFRSRQDSRAWEFQVNLRLTMKPPQPPPPQSQVLSWLSCLKPPRTIINTTLSQPSMWYYIFYIHTTITRRQTYSHVLIMCQAQWFLSDVCHTKSKMSLPVNILLRISELMWISRRCVRSEFSYISPFEQINDHRQIHRNKHYYMADYSLFCVSVIHEKHM